MNGLTGMGIFVRAGTDHPVAVAVNLDLRPMAPRVDRPWAGRVTVSLKRPGPNGLAHDVKDIERLAKLGQAMVTRAVGDAVLAAAVTERGSRTWLLYASGADGRAVASALSDAAHVAFADQADYVPTIAVHHDPAWGDYFTLCPTAAETEDIRTRRAEAEKTAAAREATHATVRSMRSAGIDLTRSAPVRYALVIPPDAAGPIERRAAADGLDVQRTGPGTLAFQRQDLPDLALILRTERWLIREAARAGGRYVGWTAVQAAA